MGTGLWLGLGSNEQWLAYGFHQRALHLGLLVLAGAGVYFATLWVLGFRLSHFRRRGVA